MKFQQRIQKVGFHKENEWLIGIPEEESVQIYNNNNQQVLQSNPGHLDHKVKSGSVDPTGKFLATTGTDGYLNIYSINQNQLSLLKKHKVCESKIRTNPNFMFDIQWLQDGEVILISG